MLKPRPPYDTGDVPSYEVWRKLIAAQLVPAERSPR
jgi:hypothetical protein